MRFHIKSEEKPEEEMDIACRLACDGRTVTLQCSSPGVCGGGWFNLFVLSDQGTSWLPLCVPKDFGFKQGTNGRLLPDSV